MFQEHAQVVLASPLPSLGLEPGDVGVVVARTSMRALWPTRWSS